MNPSEVDEGEVNEAFHRSVDQGTERLLRSLPSLLVTGAVGGLDVTVGVFAMMVVRSETGSPLLGALAFTSGFVALTLAKSELFTENFLVPVAAIVARNAPWWTLPRLWLGTLAMNVVAGWIAIGLVMSAMPHLHPMAIEIGSHPPSLGVGWQSFASAILAGSAVTLMTWMERGNDSASAKIVAAVSIAFLLAAAPLQHSVVASIEMFSALQVGAPFGYLDWFGTFAWACAGNLLGGLGLVTLLRLVQVGTAEIRNEQNRETKPPRD